LKSGGPTDLNVGAGLLVVLLESGAQFNNPMICEPSLRIIVVNLFAQFEPILLFVAQEIALLLRQLRPHAIVNLVQFSLRVRVLSMKTDSNKIDISAVEDHGGILTIRGGGARRDWNGIHYKQGISGKNAGTTSLSANIATIPPGGVAYAHIHVGFEVILYIIEGKVRHEFGPGLKQAIENEAGDFIYIKPGVPHEVFNMSDTKPVVAFVARSSANEWDEIIPYDRNEPG
jgi:uncharacterized RmlC-like cupin family protein